MQRPLRFRAVEVHDPRLKQVLNDYSFKPSPTFYRLPDDGTEALYLGWEIECEARNPVPLKSCGHGYNEIGQPVYQAAEQGPVLPTREYVLEKHVFPLKEIYAKSDSSINYGAELVSFPGTWRFWKSYDWSFTERLREYGWRSYDTETCGMHVHLSRDQFTKLEQAKMVKFFRDNENLMLDLSRRCGSENQVRYARINKTESIVTRLFAAGQGSRYEAVNLRNEKTVEIRIFRGTLNPAGIMRNLALCQAIGKFVKVASVSELSANTFSDWLSAKGSVYLGRKAGLEVSGWVKRTIVPVDTGY